MINTIYFQRYHMELALIMYLCENDSHVRFIRLIHFLYSEYLPSSIKQK